MSDPPTEPTASAPPGAGRRARDALLLELGALVYELHRHGRRAPELLQATAVALDELQAQLPAPTGPGPDCPHCSTPAHAGQLVCLECGERLALGGATVSPGRRLPLIVAASVIALLGAVAFGFALSELTSDEGDGAALARPAATTAAATATERPSAGVAGVRQEGGRADGGSPALAAWPEGEEAYTVVLVTSSDEPAARAVAQEAAGAGLEAGLLDSDEYAELGTGLWIVFAGRFPDSAAAEREAATLGARYEGAYAQQVVPQSSQ